VLKKSRPGVCSSAFHFRLQ